MVTIEFIKEFAHKKKGDTGEYDSMIASRIIQEGYAKKRVRKTVKATDKKED